MKQIKFLPIILCSMFFAEVSLAAKSSKQVHVNEYGKDVAKSVSLLLKNSKNVKSFMGNFKGYYTSKDIRQTSKLLLSKGVSQKSKIPSFVRKGSRIVFNNANYIDFISPNLLVVNGIKVRRLKTNLEMSVATIMKKIESKQKLSFFQRIFFSEAHALTNMQGILTLIAGGAAGAVVGERYFGTSQMQGGLIGLGLAFVANEFLLSNKDGEVSCTPNGNYQISSKERGSFLQAKNEYSRVSATTLSAAGLPSTCTENRAEQLQNMLDSGDIGGSSTVEVNTGSSNSIF